MRPIHAIWIMAIVFLLSASLAISPTPENHRLDIAALEAVFQNNRGHIMFINLWATWCPPCREEFPDIVHLSKTYAGSEVRFISISVDDVDEWESKIQPFLKRFEGDFPVYVQDVSDPQLLIDRFNPRWSGALPATFIYDKRGVQQAFILGKRDLKFFKEEIDKVIRDSRDPQVKS